jgi:hypothetical protein
VVVVEAGFVEEAVDREGSLNLLPHEFDLRRIDVVMAGWGASGEAVDAEEVVNPLDR